MTLEQRINAFIKLGDFLNEFIKKSSKSKNFDAFNKQLKQSEIHNAWFTQNNLHFSIAQWANALSKNNLNTWLSRYHFPDIKAKTVAIIMAGNIPLVGFHDFLCVLISGHKVLIKPSKNDNFILPFIVELLIEFEPDFKDYIRFTHGKLVDFDAVIATGSNNTARYFEFYFKNKPTIIRNNRNSVAVLTGNETPEELYALGDDIFTYFGLGCRSVSKLFVPENYNFNAFFNAIYHWHPIIEHAKYANNYDYNKAVYLMSAFNILENGFFMVKEDKTYASPIATTFFEYYDTSDKLKEKLRIESNQIQCIVANNFVPHEIAFGGTQKPNLWDYADGVDSIAFLSSI